MIPNSSSEENPSKGASNEQAAQTPTPSPSSTPPPFDPSSLTPAQRIILTIHAGTCIGLQVLDGLLSDGNTSAARDCVHDLLQGHMEGFYACAKHSSIDPETSFNYFTDRCVKGSNEPTSS